MTTATTHETAQTPGASYTDKEIYQFAERIAAAVAARLGALDSFCDRIDNLLAKADAIRFVK